MNNKIREEWVAKLRSGEYKQGMYQLHYIDKNDPTTEAWCCLGVLCDMASKAGVTVERVIVDRIETFDDCDAMPSVTIRSWAGMDQSSCERLAGMNDNGNTFEQMAHVIETDPEFAEAPK